MSEERCRHRHFWLYAYGGGRILWCYECGAIRSDAGGAGLSGWTRPVGKGGENPAMKDGAMTAGG